MGIIYRTARSMTRLTTHAMIKNYDRGFNAYRAPQQYTNYHIRPAWVRRRRTQAYRPNIHAYSLPFYYSRAGPAYKRQRYNYNRRTRNFWRWH